MPVAPVRVSNPSNGRTVDTYAALDTAAEYSLCSPELPDLLGLEGEEVLTSVVGATGTAEEGKRGNPSAWSCDSRDTEPPITTICRFMHCLR